jgi:TIR domain
MAQEFDHDVFLSHNSKDKSAVRALVDRLRNDGVRVWFDETSIATGEHIGAALERGLQTSRHIVLIMSPHTFASDWVTAERWSTLFSDPTLIIATRATQHMHKSSMSAQHRTDR